MEIAALGTAPAREARHRPGEKHPPGGGSRAYTGVLHVHSRISHDGEESIAALARHFRARGCDFLCVTEHSDGLGRDDLRRIEDECAAASDSGFLVVPGVEYSCVRHLHLLGIGVTEPVDSGDPVRVARHIRGQRGLAVLAHPFAYEGYIPEDLAPHLDGLEIWSLPKDGRLAPGAEPLRLWRRWAERHPGLRGLAAVDLHSFRGPDSLRVEVEARGLTRPDIVDALRRGPLRLRGPWLSLSGRTPPGPGVERLLAAANGAYRRLRRLRNRARSRLHLLGIPIPD